MYYNLEFEHYGVKGMKWGRRKASKKRKGPKTGESYRKSIEAIGDKYAFGNKGVDRIAKKIDSGKTYKQAFVSEFGRSMLKSTLLSAGTVLVMDIALGGPISKNIGAAGRAVTTRIMTEMGHTDISWVGYRNPYKNPIIER